MPPFLFFFLLLSFPFTSSAQLSPFPLLQQDIKVKQQNIKVKFQTNSTYDNHIEFGLSIDPNTSSLSGRRVPQIQSLINQARIDLQGTFLLSQLLGVKTQLKTQLEDYIGRNDKLDNFNGLNNAFSTEFILRLNNQLPRLRFQHQIQRLDREDDVYDYVENQIGFQFGEVFKYHLRFRSFDDDQTRRDDFLLVGSRSQLGIWKLQFGILKNLLGRFEYQVEHQRYKDNLNNLVLGIAKISPGNLRTDWKHLFTTRLIQIPTDQIIIQEDINFFQNNSSTSFYDFVSFEFGGTGFYRMADGHWFKLRLSALQLNFKDRKTIFQNQSQSRINQQIGIDLLMSWKLADKFSLLFGYQLVKNRINEKSKILDFLNYYHNIISIKLTYD